MKERLARAWGGIEALLRQPGVWTGLKITLAVALVGYIATQVRPADLIQLWRNVSLPWLATGVLAYIGITAVTALRYWHLIDRQISFRQTFGLVVVQTVLGNFVATSAGLASYVTILRGRHQVRVSQAVWSVLVSRYGDLIALLCALALAVWAIWPQIAALHVAVVTLLGALGAAALMITLVFLIRQRAAAWLMSALSWQRLDRIALSRRLKDQIQVIAAHHEPILNSRMALMLGYSAMILILQFTLSYAYTQMLAIPLNAWEVLFILAFGLLIGLVPIQVFGGLGVTEMTTLYLYQLFGVGADTAVSAAISARLFLYLLNLIILLYLPFETIMARQTPQPPQTDLSSGLEQEVTTCDHM